MQIHANPEKQTLAVVITVSLKPEDRKTHSCRVTIAPTNQEPTKTVILSELPPTGPVEVLFEKDHIPAGTITIAAKVVNNTGEVVLNATRDLSEPVRPLHRPSNPRRGASLLRPCSQMDRIFSLTSPHGFR